jgi:predicted nucleic acid-binding protein
MAFVQDASSALLWCFQDEATPATEHLLASAASGVRIYVPSNWPLELLNVLTRAKRRGRVDDQTIHVFLKELGGFNVVLDTRPMNELWAEALPLIRTYQLSAYDAAYLALAKRLSVPLAMFDSRLRDSAILERVALQI